jgi:hypothetical protein
MDHQLMTAVPAHFDGQMIQSSFARVWDNDEDAIYDTLSAG